MIGQRLLHYEIMEKLGEGGMGAVYQAEDTVLQRTVAVKVIGGRIRDDAVARARLLREARTASSLNHPNICTVYEVGESAGQTFIAMEYVQGQPLSGMIPEGGLLPEQALRYGLQIAEALAHSHERGVVHRDLKTSNVMITPEGRVKVLDFGLAKRMAKTAEGDDTTRTDTYSLTGDGAIAGTLSYMSPEALRGEPVDARGDVWSFGVLLYEMAAGRMPFEGRNLLDVSAAVLRAPMPELPAAAGAGLRAIIERCLAREPAQRYQRGGELRAALEAIQSASRAAAPAATQTVSRRKWLSIAGAAATAVVAGGAVAVLWRPRKARIYAPLPSKVAEANEYLRRAMLFLGTQQDLPRARPLLEKALELDPHFAYARAWYGFTHLLLIDSGLSNDTAWLYKAEGELRRALQDDPNSARAHAALAFVYMYQGRKELMAQEARKTIELDPNEREGTVNLAMYYQLNGDIQAAQALWRKLLNADPLFVPALWNFGENLRQMGDPDGSIHEQEKVLQQDPKNVLALELLAMAHMTKGDLTKARQALERARALEPRNYGVRILWALELALERQRKQALREMGPEVLNFGERVNWSSVIAEFYAVLGDKPQALDWLDRAVRAGDERAEWFQRDALLTSIRDEPRFRQILESIRYRRGRSGKN